MNVPRALGPALLCATLASTLSGCSGTLDSLGTNSRSNGGSGGVSYSLGRVAPPAQYPNAFANLQPPPSETEITNKLKLAFEQLFEQSILTQGIYNPQAGDQAVVQDIRHNDVRTEGIGLAMLITVELGQRDYFDPLWRFSKANLQLNSGDGQGYFKSNCGEETKGTPCLDSYGMQQFVLALMLANSRWGTTTAMPYARDALDLLDLLQNGVGGTFDAETHLVREEPSLDPVNYTRSSLEMPAAYWYWAQATGNPFWKVAADAARKNLVAGSDATSTGLWPIRSNFDGTPVPDSLTFTAETYRTHLNLALDALWGNANADEARVADRVLGFFAGIDNYGQTFTTDGTPIDSNPAQALISVNGALTVAAPASTDRAAFVKAVWAQQIPSGDNRYYDGLMYMMSLLIMSGRMQVQPPSQLF